MFTGLLLLLLLIAVAYLVSIPRRSPEDYMKRRWGNTPHEHALDNPALDKARQEKNDA